VQPEVIAKRVYRTGKKKKTSKFKEEVRGLRKGEKVTTVANPGPSRGFIGRRGVVS